MSKATCEVCGTFTSCVECDFFTCKNCGADLSPKTDEVKRELTPADNEWWED